MIEHGSDMALVNKEIEIPDEGFVNEHVRKAFDESDYEVVRIENTGKVVLVYVEQKFRAIF